MQREEKFQLLNFMIERDQQDVIDARISTAAGEISLMGSGEGVLIAFIDALQRYLDRKIEITHYVKHAITAGTKAKAVCYIQLDNNGTLQTGVACHKDIVSASLNAVLTSLST